MKKSILVLSAVTVITSAIVTSCNSHSEKVENAQAEVTEAQNDLNKANEQYLEDIKNYKIETSEKITANEKIIAEFDARIKDEKKDARAEYKIKIAALEKKNSDMKMKMDNYQLSGKENWEKFKMEFTHDMDELGNAFKDLTVNNVK